VPHTSLVRGFLLPLAILLAGYAFGASASPAPATTSWQTSIAVAAETAPDARILVLDVASGRLLAAQALAQASHTLAAPGSTLKPLVLYNLIESDRWNPAQRIACDRKLVVAGHRLACTHPSAPPFDAREALAWSCNSYFAQVARTLKPNELGKILQTTGLLGITGLAREQHQGAQTETVAEFREPGTTDAEQLAMLGVESIRITPLELAVAYRWLARELKAHAETTAAQVVSVALADSATFGMARQASVAGISVAGKTGTAEGTASAQTHGWFAGWAPATNPQVVVVVYLPAGHGADAARVAADLLANSPMEKP
jgi:peptidoglycan glycosyltransferase